MGLVINRNYVYVRYKFFVKMIGLLVAGNLDVYIKIIRNSLSKSLAAKFKTHHNGLVIV